MAAKVFNYDLPDDEPSQPSRMKRQVETKMNRTSISGILDPNRPLSTDSASDHNQLSPSRQRLIAYSKPSVGSMFSEEPIHRSRPGRARGAAAPHSAGDEVMYSIFHHDRAQQPPGSASSSASHQHSQHHSGYNPITHSRIPSASERAAAAVPSATSSRQTTGRKAPEELPTAGRPSQSSAGSSARSSVSQSSETSSSRPGMGAPYGGGMLISGRGGGGGGGDHRPPPFGTELTTPDPYRPMIKMSSPGRGPARNPVSYDPADDQPHRFGKKVVANAQPSSIMFQEEPQPPSSHRSEASAAAMGVETVPSRTGKLDDYSGPTDYCNWVVPGRILWGAYPRKEDLTIFAENGIDLYVNLMETTEMRKKRIDYMSYLSSNQIINLAIPDGGVPSDASLVALLHTLLAKYREGKNLYIHCHAGHGRSGVVAASLLGLLSGSPAADALRRIEFYHNTRKYEATVAAPTTHGQRMQVYRMLQ